MGFIEAIIGGLITGYIIFKLERIDSRQDDIDLRLSMLERCMPKRHDDYEKK